MLYDIGIRLYYLGVVIASVFNSKASLWLNGRKDWQLKLKEFQKKSKIVWIHCASLGEYEQAKPIIQELRQNRRDFEIVLSFFSPSGFENFKDHNLVKEVLYLPLDTVKNANLFIDKVQPDIVLIIKNEFWLNYLENLANRQIPTFLIAAHFREDQLFFKWYGKRFYTILTNFNHIFVQFEESKKLLIENHIRNVSVAGDTRFERVFQIAQNAENNDLVANFKQDDLLLLAGSCWEDELDVIQQFEGSHNLKIVLAPHDISLSNLDRIKKRFKNLTFYSEIQNSSNSNVLVIDNIGLLSSLYRYADIAIVGGGFTGKLHNILEPAAHGVPVLYGNQFDSNKFMEASHLIKQKGALTGSKGQLEKIIKDLIKDSALRQDIGTNAKRFIESNLGSTNRILKEIFK